MGTKLLIILRGPTGVGKTKISNILRIRLGIEKTFLLNLDQVNPLEFNQSLQEAVKHDNVIGEMYYGNSHTTTPQEWLSHFNNYRKISIVLSASKETCYKRLNLPDREWKISDFSCCHKLWKKFEDIQKSNIFASNAGIKEVTIDAEEMPNQIVDEIMNLLKNNY
jgi:broad-specificity NMP kinase